MKILSVNQDWFAEEFRAAGHEVISCGINPGLEFVVTAPFLHLDSIIRSLPGGFQPDKIIFWDNSSPLIFTGFDETTIPVLFYSVDTHHHFDLHSYLYNTFDQTFVAQSDYLPFFQQKGQSPQAIPLWASRYVEASDDKQHGAVFVGNINPELNPERKIFFDDLVTKVPVLLTRGEYWKIFPHSEIVINQTVKKDLNFRVFEAMMCGSLLITERTDNGLLELFKDGEHLVTYTKNDTTDAAEKIRYYLDHKDQARAIAHAGREEILAKHRPIHRAQIFLATLEKLEKQKSKLRHLSTLVNFSTLAHRLHQKKVDQSAHFQAYVCGLRSAEAALRCLEPMTDEIALHLFTAAFGYDLLSRRDTGRTLVLQYEEAYPELVSLKLAKIWILLNSGKEAEARKLAEVSSNAPTEETFKKVQEIMTGVVLQPIV